MALLDICAGTKQANSLTIFPFASRVVFQKQQKANSAPTNDRDNKLCHMVALSVPQVQSDGVSAKIENPRSGKSA